MRFDLPLPLEVLIYRALNADGVDGRHERLVYAWEVMTCQITASTLWAVCHALSLRSEGSTTLVASSRARPSGTGSS